MEDPLGPAPDAPLTPVGVADRGRSRRAVAALLLVLAAVPALWLELVPLAWAAPFVLIYALVVVPVLVSETRRRRAAV